MAAMDALASAYGKDSDSEESEDDSEEITADHTAHLNPTSSISDLRSKFQLNCAPVVAVKVRIDLMCLPGQFHVLKTFSNRCRGFFWTSHCLICVWWRFPTAARLLFIIFTRFNFPCNLCGNDTR